MAHCFFPMNYSETKTYFQGIQKYLEEQSGSISLLVERLDELNKQIITYEQVIAELKLCCDSLLTGEAPSYEVMRQLANDLAAYKDQLLTLKTRQNDTNMRINAKLDSICTSMYNKEIPMNVQTERVYHKNFPTCASKNAPNFYRDFDGLVSGLDIESIETVCLSLKRLNILQNTTDAYMSLYSSEEKEKFRYIYEHFASSITQLSENCFYCRGYKLPINHFETSVFLDHCSIGKLQHLERIQNSDIIDAGAFIGDSALVLSEYTQETVHAFEPVPSNFNYMLKTIELNKAKRVVPQPYALGETFGNICISVHDSGSTQFENPVFEYQEHIDANVITLDSYVQKHNLRVGLIKADVEGAEQLLLKGALETIKAQKPALLISIYHSADDYFHIKPMIESWNLGYKFKIVHPVCGSVLMDTMLVAEIR